MFKKWLDEQKADMTIHSIKQFMKETRRKMFLVRLNNGEHYFFEKRVFFPKTKIEGFVVIHDVIDIVNKKIIDNVRINHNFIAMLDEYH